jgi:hypothetical protein
VGHVDEAVATAENVVHVDEPVATAEHGGPQPRFSGLHSKTTSPQTAEAMASSWQRFLGFPWCRVFLAMVFRYRAQGASKCLVARVRFARCTEPI